ncbi:MAG: hypothetical protein WBA74_11405 [Cyclobacteriaceae bacterium]
MSYLHLPRLVFSGDFLSDVSTVNNDPAHYNNDTFQKSFQEFGEGGNNGMWNPEGGAVFDFQDCSVQRLTLKDGTLLDAGELIGELVRGADGRATGKMVDLDPQQQGVSQLWAVKLRVLTKTRNLLLEGSIAPTAFRDLQYRQTGGININGQPLGGSWTSVLTDITWGENASSYQFFRELKETTQDNKLSINLNGFGYYYNHADDGRFSLGRLLGAIGPWFSGEPDTFVAERRLYGTKSQRANSPVPTYFGTTNFAVDEKSGRLSLDFGASFPVADATGTVDLSSKLFLGVSHKALTNAISGSSVPVDTADFTLIGKLDYQQGVVWLMKTGGIFDFENLDSNTLQSLKDHQLILVEEASANTYNLVARESIEGYLLRADYFVQRLDTNQQSKVDFYARQWGIPIKTAKVNITMQPATAVTPKGPNNPISEIPGNNYPRDGVTFDHDFALDNGHGLLNLKGNKIKNPRGYIDGQIYFLDYALGVTEADGSTRTIAADPAEGPMSNDSISIHLRDYFEVPQNPTWSDIAVTMTQFSNLYPIMSKYIVDLSDPQAVKAKAEILKFAFSRDIMDPIYMPVTRDLSESKRQTILKWLENPVITESLEELATLKNKSAKSELMQSPTEVGTALTEKQQRLKTAMQAKSGKNIATDPIHQLKF